MIKSDFYLLTYLMPPMFFTMPFISMTVRMEESAAVRMPVAWEILSTWSGLFR